MTRPSVGVTSWTLPFRGRHGLEWAAEQGFTHAHIDLDDVADCSPAELRSSSEFAGIEIAGLAVNRLEFLGASHQQAIHSVQHTIDLAEELGARFVYLPSFAAAEITNRDDLIATAKLLHTAARRAAPRSITVATENALPCAELTELFALADDPALELLFDTQNLSYRGIDHHQVLATHGPRIRRFVHVKDGTTRLGGARLGRGNASVRDTIGALTTAGFQGVFVIENDYRDGDTATAAADRRWLIDIVLGAHEAGRDHDRNSMSPLDEMS